MVTISQRIAASGDDAYDSNDSFPGDSTTDTTLYVGATNSTQTVYTGLRWAGVNIPSGATINSASITGLRIGFSSDGNEQVTIYIQHAQAPSGFTAGTDSPFDRFGAATFGTGTAWSLGADGGGLDPEKSPDLATPLQAALDAVGGITDLVMVILGDGTVSNAQMNAYSYDNTPGNAFLLEVDYTAGAGGGSAPKKRGLALLGVGR